MHSGSLESSNPLRVVRDDGEPMCLERDRVTQFVSENGVPVKGWVPTAEGRGESGNAMLDLSVSGLASVVDPSAVGWASLPLWILERHFLTRLNARVTR